MMKTNEKWSLGIIGDVLPLQSHYYLLSDGRRFARHGSKNYNGVLVFTNLERAEQFYMTIGNSMPKYQPVKVAAADFIAEAVEAGAFSLASGIDVKVCILREES